MLIILLYCLTDQMIDSFTTDKKLLKNINQQQNNYNLNNHFPSTSKHSKLNYNHATNKKVFVKDSADKKSKKKAVQHTNDKQVTSNRQLKYYEPFQRTPQQTERQQQNCQNYFLRKTIMALYKLFQRLQLRWNLYELNYSQLLKILHQLGYIRFNGNQQINEKMSEDLKKCYWIWINISEGKKFNLCNLIVILFCIENLQYQEWLIQEIVTELTKGIQKLEIDCGGQDPKYIFLVKNQRLRFKQGILQITKAQIQKIQIYLKDLRFNRLMDNHHVDNIEKQIESNVSLLSKRSEQLAQTKRQKIVKQIKQKQPLVQQIELHHLLSYKNNKIKQRPMKTENCLIRKDKNKQNDRKKQGKKVNTNPNQYLLQQAKCKNLAKSYKPKIKSKSIEKHNKKADIQTRSKEVNKKFNSLDNRQTIEFQFDQFYSEELKKVNQKQNQPKNEIIDQLQWEQIPKVADQIKMDFQLFQSKDDFNLCPPLSHTFSKIPQDKQRKRKQYLDLPILFVDVNIEQGKKQRIVIYQGDKASDLALQFGRKHKLNDEMINRLQNLLQLQIGSVLTKIDESNQQDCSQLY